MDKSQIKKRLKEQRFFYLEGDEFHGNYGTKKNPFVVFETFGEDWDTEERRARTLAKKIFKKKLAGGMFVGTAKPYDFEENYVVVKVPKIIKPQKVSASDKFINNIINYEAGNLNKTKTKQLFNKLRKTGIGYKLQGHYSSRM
jgi:hypothetical protein